MLLLLLAAFLALVFLTAGYRRARERRILSLNWGAFSHRSQLIGSSIAFLHAKGWYIHRQGKHDVEFTIRKDSYEMVAAVLINKDWYPKVPDHFLNHLALGALNWKRPFLLVTDFPLPKGTIEQCNRRHVYPLHYVRLPELEQIIPKKDEFLARL